MPGYNHYSWCVCGWCYKHGWNGYSSEKARSNFDRSFAQHRLKETGASRSWTACFVNPNARCPVCGAQVFFYGNQRAECILTNSAGLGRSTPVPTTDRTAPIESTMLFQSRSSRGPEEPSPRFRGRYVCRIRSERKISVGIRTVSLGSVDRGWGKQSGFENVLTVRSISPPLDDPFVLSFVSAKLVPSIGDYVSFDGSEVHFRWEVLDQNRELSTSSRSMATLIW